MVGYGVGKGVRIPTILPRRGAIFFASTKQRGFVIKSRGGWVGWGIQVQCMGYRAKFSRHRSHVREVFGLVAGVGGAHIPCSEYLLTTLDFVCDGLI